jgi:copper homeostasis protein (lipoprotein)
MTGLLLPATLALSTTLLITTHRSYSLSDRGNSGPVSFMLQRDGPSPVTPAPGPPFEKTYWKATELLGKPVPPASRNREPHLVFEQDGRLAGADGCNRITGTYERTAEAIKFGPMVSTRMACVDTGEIERAFREALQKTGRWKIVGNELELSDIGGSRLARFEASADK